MKIVNAKIDGTMLGVEDHGIMTCYLHLDYGDGGHQAFGGYSMDTPIKAKTGCTDGMGRVGTAFGCELVKRIIETVGAAKWEDLKGYYIRVKYNDPNGPMIGDFSEKILAIGHIIEDRWLSLDGLVKEMKELAQ